MKFKKICALFTVSVLIVTNLISTYAKESQAEIGTFSEEVLLTQDASNIAYNNILRSFEIDEEGDSIYDEDYAGAYLNDEGQLVVLIAADEATLVKQKNLSENNTNLLSTELITDSSAFKTKSAKFKNAALELEGVAEISAQSEIVFQEAKYSYTYLTELMSHLNDAFSENYLNPDSVWSRVAKISILDNLNSISVEILELDDKKIQAFKSEASDSGAIIFENADEFQSPPTSQISSELENVSKTLRASAPTPFRSGQVLRISTPGGFNEIGQGSGGFVVCHGDDDDFDAELSFITAGHVANVGDEVYDGGGRLMGICIESKIGGEVDAAIIEPVDALQLTAITSTNSRFIDNDMMSVSMAVGATVYKDGYMTGETAGTVVTRSATIRLDLPEYQDPIIKDVYGVDIEAIGGDSGGLGFTSRNVTFGIVCAGGSDGVVHFTKVSNITDEFDVDYGSNNYNNGVYGVY